MNRPLIFALLLSFSVAFAGAVSRADEATNQFNAAKSAFDMKQYSQARTGFETFLARNRNHAQANEATFYLAEALLYLEEYPQAEIYYNQLATLDLNNPYARVALFRLGDVAYIQARYDVAKTRLEQFVEKLPHDINLQFVLYYLGDIAMRNDFAEEAEHYFRQSVTMYPQGPKFLESQIGLAWAKNHLGYASEANAIFQDLLRSNDPTILEPATYQWGVAQYERSDYQGAVSTLADFQRRWPRSTYFADSQRVMARCKGGLNDFDGALQILSQIAQPSIDDELLKVRCLYRQRQFQNAMDILTQVERRAGPEYRDEITLLQSVFFFDQKNWSVTQAKLESILMPNYNQQANRMTFNYLSRPVIGNAARLPDDTVLKACALLALTYAKSGDNAKADATIREMQSQATMLGGSELYAIVTETEKYLTTIYAENNNSQPGNNRPGGNRPGHNRPGGDNNGGNIIAGPGGSNGTGQWNPGGKTDDTGKGGQWNPGNQIGNGGQWNAGNRPNDGRPNRPGSSTNGNDLAQFQSALQQFERNNWTSAAQQLDQLLGTSYNRYTKQATIAYAATGANDTMNAVTTAKACSMLVLSRAQLGDFDQANALLTAFAGKIQMSDSTQRTLLSETQNELFELARNGGTPSINQPDNRPGQPETPYQYYSEAEQKAILRESNALYRNRRFDQVDAKLRDLLAKNPSEAVHAEALLLQSKTVKELGREREAIQLLETICQDHMMSAQYADALWYLGTYYESGGDLERAAEYFEPLTKEFPNHKNIDGALYFLGLNDMEHGTGKKANSYFSKIYKNYQHGKFWSHAVWMLAYEAYRKRDYALAESYVQKVLQHPPDRVILDRVLYLKGELALRNEEYETAFLAFREVGKLCPDSPLRHTADKNMQVAAEKTLASTTTR